MDKDPRRFEWVGEGIKWKGKEKQNFKIHIL